MFFQKITDQGLNILLTFAQRRHGQLHHLQPVIQILAEFPFANQLFQIPVGGRQNPYINLLRLYAPQAFNFMGL